MPKKVTKEEKKKEIPEEPSSESSSSDIEESITPEGFNEKHLDLEELLLHLVCLRKFKRSTEDWIRDTNEILEDQVGMRETRTETTNFIKEYLHDLRIFSVRINELVKKISALTKCDE